MLTKRWRLLLYASGISLATIGVATAVFGAGGFLAAFAIGLLVTAWYGDDQLGTCLPLAVIFLVMATVMVVLVGLLMLVLKA